MPVIPPDFTPITNTGMSIVTAIFMFFGTAIFSLICWFFRREITRLDARIDEQKRSMQTFSKNIIELRTDIAVVQESITNVERMIHDNNEYLRNIITRR